MPGRWKPATGGGGDTKATLVKTRSDLEALDGQDGWYQLANDIDLAGADWIPISFTGYLDGQGHAIKNMTITPASYAAAGGGDAGFMRGAATLRAVGFENPNVNIGTDADYKAVICGNASGILIDCYAEGGSVTTDGDRAGGLIGFLSSVGVLHDCYGATEIAGSVSSRVGGLIGYTSGEVFDCYFDTDVATTAAIGGGSGSTFWRKTTSEMKTAATFSSWNDAVWDIADGSYPALR